MIPESIAESIDVVMAAATPLLIRKFIIDNTIERRFEMADKKYDLKRMQDPYKEKIIFQMRKKKTVNSVKLSSNSLSY